MFDKILVPLDGSKVAEQVFPFVKELASAFSAEIVTLGVCEPHEKEHETTCLDYVGRQARQLETSMGKSHVDGFRSVVLIGKPAEEIISYAEKNDFKLVVMASSGRSGIKPWSLGSTVDKLIREVHVPLLVVKVGGKPDGQDKAGIFNRVLAPLDQSEASEAVLPYVAALIARLKSAVTLIRILAPGKHVHTIGGLDYVPYTDHDLNSWKTEAYDYLNEVSLKLGGLQVVKKREVCLGEPADEIVKYAKRAKVQLITMSTHGHSFIERWVLGSVAYKVMHASKKSILLIPWLGEKSKNA